LLSVCTRAEIAAKRRKSTNIRKILLEKFKISGNAKKSPKSEISQTWANVFVRRRLPGSPRGHLQSDLCPYSHPVV